MSLERIERVIADRSAVAINSNSATAFNGSLSDIATCDRAHTCNRKHGFNQRATKFHNAFFWPQTTFNNGFDVFSQLVNDVIASNFDVPRISQIAGRFIWNHVEAYNYCIRCVRQSHVSQRDATDALLKNIDFDFRMLEFAEFFFNRFERTAGVGTNDDVQLGDIIRLTKLARLQQVLESFE